ncbi:MAG: right-handed parallel beta-helix repeat-containing protein, partial [Planctomycetota bacterium]
NDDAAGANDGSSWADAYKYLQDALVDAGSAEKPVEIWVAQGTYRPDLGGGQTLHDQEATFQLVDGVTLKGGFAGPGEPDPEARDVGLYETVLSGDLTGNDVVVEDPRALPAEPSRDENSYHVVTGIMTGRTALLDGFTITAGSRHGMYNKKGNPTVAYCTFRGNRAQRWGGGLCNDNGSPALNRCTFQANCAQYGGGLWNLKGSPVLTFCTFRGNSATYGGGMYNYENSHPQITNCIFSGNSATYGAGIYSNKSCRPTLINCTFAGNLADGNGGGMRNVGDSSPLLINCILWGNVPDEIVDYVMSRSSVRYCHVQGGTDKPWFGEGCIDGDPLFLGGDDLRLSPDSPCIDAGNNAAVPSEITTSLDDKPRIVNGIVDMGAFEAGAM